jgi:anti-sigma factor RsiW
MNSRDLEILSAYLDGQLSPPDSADLESRLKSDESLRRLMDDLRLARGLLRQLPQRRAPRSFTLKPTNPKLRVPQPRAYPALRLAGVLASLLFLASFAVNALSSAGTRHLAASSAPILGGGVGAGEAGTGPAEGLAQPFAAVGPNATATEMRAARALAAPTAEAPVQTAPKALPSGNAAVGNEAPVSAVWQLVLGGAAVLLAGIAWLVRQNSIRNFRSRWLEK